MQKVTYIEEYKKRKKHLENQDAFETYEEADSVLSVAAGTIRGINRISPSLTSFGNTQIFYHEYSKSKLDSAKELLEKWKSENRLNLKIRKDLSEKVEIDNHGVRIGRIYWEFSYIFQDTLENGGKLLWKFKLKVPSIEDIDACASLLPGDGISEKRINLLRLLGFNLEVSDNVKLWTSTEENVSKSGNVSLDSNLSEVIGIFKNKVKSFFGYDDKFFNLLYFYGTGIGYYMSPKNEVGNICGIRKLNNK